MPRRLLEDYLGWSSQLERARGYETLDAVDLDPSGLSGVAIVGMGGSGIVGDVVSKYLERELGLPAVAVKSYTLPRYVTSSWLVVTVSYSGETLETLSAFHEASRRRAKLGVVASGGSLMSLAERHRVPRVAIEGGHLPRAALPALLAGVLGLMGGLGLVRVDLGKGVEVLRDPAALGRAESLARFVFGGLPVFVVTEDLYPLGLRAKNEFNENSKVTSKVEVLPEWGHNDIVGLEGSPRDWLRVVVIGDGSDPLIGFACDYLRELGYDTRVLEVGRYGYLETILYGSWLVGLASILLAEIRGIDPEATASINRYREFLRSHFKPFGLPANQTSA